MPLLTQNRYTKGPEPPEAVAVKVTGVPGAWGAARLGVMVTVANLHDPRIVKLPDGEIFTAPVTATVNGQISQADEYDFRKLDTHVMIPSGNTLVMGGMVQDDIRNSNTKVPILGDLPLLGYAFQSKSKARDKSNLVIFITPRILTAARAMGLILVAPPTRPTAIGISIVATKSLLAFFS